MDQIAPRLRAHPDVLEVRWQIYMNLEKYEGALDIAKTLFKIRPERWSSWTYLANSFVETGQLQEAYTVLQQACPNFPDLEALFYDLACLCCSIQKHGEAKIHLARAIELGGDEIRLKALDDPDLKPIWENLTEVELE